jgi:hypothetical protein
LDKSSFSKPEQPEKAYYLIVVIPLGIIISFNDKVCQLFEVISVIASDNFTFSILVQLLKAPTSTFFTVFGSITSFNFPHEEKAPPLIISILVLDKSNFSIPAY